MVQDSKLIFPEISWGIRATLFAVLISITVPIIASIGLGYILSNIADFLPDYQSAQVYVLFMSFITQVVMLGSVWFVAMHKKQAKVNSLGIKKPEIYRLLRFVLVGIALTLLVPVVYGLGRAIFDVEYLQPSTLPEAISENRGSLLIFGFMAIFIAPVVEEIFFRGFVYPSIANRYGIIISAIATSFLFGLAHIIAANAIIAFFIGLILVYVYHQTTNLLTPILVHSAFNLISVIIIMVSL